MDGWGRRFGTLPRPLTGFLLLGASLVCVVVFCWLVADAVLDQRKPLIGVIYLPLIGLLTLGAAIVASWKPGRQEWRTHLVSPQGAATVTLAFIQLIAAVTSVLGLFEPRAPTTDDTDAIKRDTAATRVEMSNLAQTLSARFPADPPILHEIAGRWGEQDTCALVWNIRIIEHGNSAALEAQLVVKPNGVGPFRLLADITDAEAYTLNVTGEEPVSARGRAAVFTLNPATQRLVWDDKSSAGGIEEYVRCPAG
jgi:hypothetical protein